MLERALPFAAGRQCEGQIRPAMRASCRLACPMTEIMTRVTYTVSSVADSKNEFIVGSTSPRYRERPQDIGVTATLFSTEETMANVYVEARPKGRPEHSPIEGYVVEDHADHVLHTATTQELAIAWARKEGHKPLVARVRHLNDKKNPDHWRAA
jgi:hypothetical protein